MQPSTRRQFAIVRNRRLYDAVMQIAITIPDEQVDEIDQLVPSQFRSRAEVVRVAIDDLLKTLRRQRLDAAYLVALDDADAADPASGRLQAGDSEPAGWAEIPW